MTDITLNGAELAILNSRFEGVVRKMANTLLRTGRSGVLNRAKDFSCCIVTADCELLAAAESLPIHVLSGPDMMARSMKDFHPLLTRGDAFLHNSPYHGCSHPADLSLLVPVIDDDGVHRFTVVAKAHQADIGNSEPTTYMGNARDVYHEGALIFPAVQVQRDYQDIGDIIRMCEMRIRVPEQWRGDYLATVGAVRIGEKELMAMGRDVGWDKLDAFARQWFDYSEAAMIEALKALPDGTVSGSSTHDPFPGMPAEGVTITSHITIDTTDSRITVDLTDNPDCLPCGMNLSEACARTAAMIGVFNSVDHRVPKNAGAFRRINVQLRRGCIAGIPEHPFSCSAATTNIADRVANSVQVAIARLGQGAGMAEVGAVIAPSAGVISGVDVRNGKAFVNQIFLAFSGGAASPHADAWWTTAHVGNAGMCCIDGVELDELYQPILVKKRGFVTDSEGAGEYTGAPSTVVEFGPLMGAFDIGYGSDGHINEPKGVRGGQNGGRAEQWLNRNDGSVEQLPSCALVHVTAGDVITAISTGGGGYGHPVSRAPESVANDVREGYLTSERARTVYKVVLDAAGQCDRIETNRLRTDS
ncbi:hydantoinase B/oxoprolinase family protein [Govanella unica]|uniref:Hydantoinase B/oxoprolinase family protein n=1 Tax=Govanella unica TaxID=2975056 RepID=A0A9X3TZ64_9PROT|nr:hydantoinase B/oxoprolinase family protein [Govania unica]MDA5194397.1 hydantoinase B/oxoprolinase family protein [Govania unica]